MGEFDTVVSMLGDRFDRIDVKLDEYLKRQEELANRVTRIEERQSSLSSQFKTVLGAIGATLLACVGVFTQFIKF